MHANWRKLAMRKSVMADKKPEISKDVQEKAEKIAQALFKTPYKPLKVYGSSPPKKVKKTKKK